MSTPRHNDLGTITPYGDGWAKITNLLTETGDVTTDALEAASAVAYVLDGVMAGMFVAWPIEDPDEFIQELYQVC